MALARAISMSLSGVDQHKLANMISEYSLIDIAGNKHVPEIVFDPSIKVLRLMRCGLKHLSPSIGRMTKLDELNVSNNSIETLPSCLHKLAVSTLILYNNPIVHLSPRLSDLPIKNLLISKTRVRRLPDLPEVQWLSISNNPDLVFRPLCNLRSLSKLEAAYMGLSSIPRKLGNEYLDVLNVSGNKLTDLDFISQYPNLRVLRADYNPLGRIDETILAKSALRIVTIRGAGITTAQLDRLHRNTGVQFIHTTNKEKS